MKSIFPLLILVALYGCASKPAPAGSPPVPSLPVATLLPGSDTTYREYPASIEGVVNLEIRPQVSGAIEKIYVDEGAFVKAGEPLFKINDQPFVAQLNNSTASLHAAQAALLNAQLEVDKLIPLVENKVVSDYQLKTARAAFQIAQANVEQTKALVTNARISLGYTLVKAPVSGYIGRLSKKQGSLVAPTDAEAITFLSDVHEVHVYFSLSENDFTSFKAQYPGQSLKDKLKQIPSIRLMLSNNEAFTNLGKIDMIDGQFDKNTGAITLRASFLNPQGLLRSGNTGKVRLSQLHADVLKIPESATIELQDKVFVFALADSNKVKKQPITIIGKSGTNYLVTEGVRSGDQIVLSGLDHLQEGQVISPEKHASTVAKN